MEVVLYQGLCKYQVIYQYQCNIVPGSVYILGKTESSKVPGYIVPGSVYTPG